MPRLNCTFGEFIAILEQYGFTIHRDQDGSSHYRYRGVIEGKVRYVDCCGTGGTVIKIGTLQSMIRQSGLPKKLFRK